MKHLGVTHPGRQRGQSAPNLAQGARSCTPACPSFSLIPLTLRAYKCRFKAVWCSCHGKNGCATALFCAPWARFCILQAKHESQGLCWDRVPGLPLSCSSQDAKTSSLHPWEPFGHTFCCSEPTDCTQLGRGRIYPEAPAFPKPHPGV